MFIIPGLLVHDTYPYIRVSLDRIIICSCHGKKLVEVKCSYFYRNQYLMDIVKQGKLDYVHVVDNEIFVKKGQSRGYFEQITLQLALSKVTRPEMLVWSKVGYIVIPVQFDEVY